MTKGLIERETAAACFALDSWELEAAALRAYQYAKHFWMLRDAREFWYREYYNRIRDRQAQESINS